MSPKGAQLVIDSIDLRIFEIEDIEARVRAEKAILRARREELTKLQEPIVPDAIVSIQ
jgi:hypothetical protein